MKLKTKWSPAIHASCPEVKKQLLGMQEIKMTLPQMLSQY
jgi:hypothetical protein